jgi:hypothetical protein
MDDRERRVAENETIFNAINERIVDLNAEFNAANDLVSIVCECGDDRCIERIEIDSEDYAEVHRQPDRFVVVPGHAILETERVIEQAESYEVVEKTGVGAEIAKLRAPRSTP